MRTHPRARRLAAPAAALAMIVAACGTADPSPSGTPIATSAMTGPTGSARPAAEIYAEVRDAVVAIRGLQPTAAVDPVTIDEAELRENFEAEFDRTYTQAQLQDTEDLLITLGLLPPGASLRGITLDFQTGQIAGYYSPEEDELFVVSRSGGVGALERATYAHEFTHQLQDQRIDLDALGLDASDQSDRALARLAVVEGDAVSVQAAWMTEHLDARELGEVLAAALDPQALEALQRAPAYLRDTATFPYEDGFAFVSRILAGGGYEALNAVYEDPPDSTEQVLHPDLYLSRQPPIAVELPAGLALDLGAGWGQAAQDTLGELILRIWLREGGVTVAGARAASAGWGGDRVVLLRGPDGAIAVGLVSEWDTAADAREFADAASSAINGHALVAHAWLIPESSRVVVTFGEWYSQLAAALGA